MQAAPVALLQKVQIALDTGPAQVVKYQNVLAIVVSIDPVVLMPGSKKVLSVWASTNRVQ